MYIKIYVHVRQPLMGKGAMNLKKREAIKEGLEWGEREIILLYYNLKSTNQPTKQT